jgi:antitoxin (DNA-binding transcriptional repressor) of toxin-antitoxin stability system
MYHMTKKVARQASVRDLRYDFPRIERFLRQGEEIRITKRRHVIARLLPEPAELRKELPNFLGRLHELYGRKALAVSGAQLLAEDRNRS